ncbi:MAG: enoyl-CoA hydratase-related protein [Candidatus Binatia bacterium]
MIDLRREGAVFVLTMRAGENRFNRAFVTALGAALDEVEGPGGPAALVTVGAEKFYSNGLDLTWLAGDGASEGGAFIRDFLRLLGRVLALPLPTVAAINGHAYAGGGMLALTHDFRVMRADRGYFCLPEADIKLPFAPGMSAMIIAKLDPPVSRDLMLTGRRLGGQEAAALRVVDEAVDADQVLPRAIERAAALADKDRATYQAIKRRMYAEAIGLLEAGAVG